MSNISPTRPDRTTLPASSGRRKRITFVAGAIGRRSRSRRGRPRPARWRRRGHGPVPSSCVARSSAVVAEPGGDAQPARHGLHGGTDRHRAQPVQGALRPACGCGVARCRVWRCDGRPACRTCAAGCRPRPPRPTTTPPATPAPVAAYRVKLVSVGDLQGDVRPMLWNVAGTAQTVYKGQLFGATGELQVLSISRSTGCGRPCCRSPTAARRSSRSAPPSRSADRPARPDALRRSDRLAACCAG